jgi:hypothetical protein
VDTSALLPSNIASSADLTRLASGYCLPLCVQMSWEDFRLSAAEEVDLSRRISSRLQSHGPVLWLVLMVDIIRKDACGYIGLFRCLLDHGDLLANCPFTDKNQPTLQDALRYYFGAMFDSWIAKRFFQWKHPDPDQAEMTVRLLRRIVPGGRVLISDLQAAGSSVVPAASAEEQEISRKLLHIPVFFEAAGCAAPAFASDLHRRFYLRQLYPSAVRPEEFVRDMDERVLQVVSTFEPS